MRRTDEINKCWPSANFHIHDIQPETGTTSYTYQSNTYGSYAYPDSLLSTKTDANGAVTTYSYDAYGRPTTITRGLASHGADPCQSTNYLYDVNPNNAGANAWGQVAMSWSGDLDNGRTNPPAGNPVCVVQTLGGTALKQAFLEDYSYTAAGQMSIKTMQMRSVQGGGALATRAWKETVTYDPYGMPVQLKYPDWDNGDGSSVTSHTVTYGYNLLGQVGTYFTDQLQNAQHMTNSSNAIQGTSYNAAGQPTSLTYSGYGETRTYNSLNQLTGISVSAANVNLAYIYPAGTNNGQITSMTDGPSTVSYGYDALKRLTSASATGGTAWSQTFGYDGFGNLDSKSGSSAWTASISATTNRVNGYCYDSNGNMLASNTNCGAPMYTYDIQNRITGGLATGSGSGSVYLYNTANKRVAVIDGNGNETVYFYGVRGEKLMTMPLGGANQAVSNVYFGGKLIERMNQYGGQLIWTDRLGSVKNGPAVYLPYGEELTSTANDTEKFGTYTRDAATGLDYADQRFYNSVYGRFMSPDRKGGNGLSPGSLNKYSYVGGDPINRNDPSGLCAVMLSGITMGPGTNSVWTNEAVRLGADSAYPYEGEGAIRSVASVVSQASGPNDSTAAALMAIRYSLASNSGLIYIIAYSGGAAAFTAAYGQLDASERARIGLVQYISPGSATALANVAGTTSVVMGTSGFDWAATVGTQVPRGVPIQSTSCDHTDIGCLLGHAQALSAITANGPCNNPLQFTRTNPFGGPVVAPGAGGSDIGGSSPKSSFSLFDLLVDGPYAFVNSTITFDMNP